MDNRISIIIPFYNEEQFLAECVESVLSGGLTVEYEIILSDDGSTDASAQIADRYAAEHANIRVIHERNGGLSCARNRGLKLATGTYVFFLDSDDLVAPGYLPALYKQAEEAQSDVVAAGFTAISEDGLRRNPIIRSVLEQRELLSGCAFLHARMDQNDWNNEVWCALYRRSFLEERDLWFREDIRLYEDIYFSSQVMLYARRVSTRNEYGYFYRIRDRKSLVHGGQPTQRDVDACLQVLRELCALHSTLKPDQKKALGRVLFQLISMTLYYIGTIRPDRPQRLYRRLKEAPVMHILRGSITTGKERIKYLIFRFCMGLYYPLVKKENAGELL